MPAAINWTPELVKQEINRSRQLQMARLPQEQCDCSQFQDFHRVDCQFARDARKRMEDNFRREKLGE